MKTPEPAPRAAKRPGWPFRPAELALALAACLLAALLAEAVLRAGYAWRRARAAPAPVDMRGSSEAYDDPADYYGKWDTNPAVDYSTYLGYVSRAGVAGNGYRTNRHHARHDEEFPEPKPEGETRVFVTGGSTCWGQGVEQRQLFTAVAERRFAERPGGGRVRVASMGVTGYCSVQERIMTENLLLGLEPDYVVMMSGWNDSYLGYSGKDILVEHDFFKFRQVLARRIPGVAPPPGQPAIYPPAHEDYGSKLAYFLAVRLFAWRHPDAAAIRTGVARQALPPERVVAVLLRNLETQADLARRHGFRFVFYLQPSIYATRKTLSRREAEMARAAEASYVGFADYNRAVYAAYRERLPAHAERNCYSFVDGDAAVREEPLSVFVDHVHFGSRGNRLLGEHLFRELSGMMSGGAGEGRCADPVRPS